MLEDIQYKFNNSHLEDMWHIFFCLSSSNSFEMSIGSKGRYGISTEAMMSVQNTITTIDFCHSRNAYSDAFTLIRKCRDDLMQYLFILHVIQNTHGLTNEELENYTFDEASIIKMIEADFSILISGKRKNEVQLAMESWMYNELENSKNSKFRRNYFDASKYKKYLMSADKNIEYIMNNFLNPLWNSSDRILNNYVHANGRKYLTDNYVHQLNKEKIDSELIETLQHIVDIFLSLLAIIDSTKMMSSDYVDYMEMNAQPPENCQYWVLPCIVEYLNNHLENELLTYIQENEKNGMKFMSTSYDE